MTKSFPDVTASLLAEGRLNDAIAGVTAVVKAKPTSAADRILLAELLVLQGNHERADNQLQLAGDHAPAELLAISQMRWLLRAAAARQAWYDEGAAPTFIGEPTQHQRDVLRLALHVRDGEAEDAGRLLSLMEETPCAAAVVDGAEAEPFRDICDLSQHGFEALALDGRYFWISPEQMTEIRLAPVMRPRDLIWRKADVSLTDGRDAVFYFVAQYHHRDTDEAHNLAKTTDWVKTTGGVTVGRGQKTMLIGDYDRGFLDIEHIVMKAAA